MNYVLLGLSRTGSTSLEHILNDQSEIYHDFTRLPNLKDEGERTNFVLNFERIHSDKPELIKGFKCLYYQYDNKNIVTHLTGNPSYKKIFLYREKIYKVVLSKAISRQTNQWHLKLGDEFKECEPFNIDIEWLKDNVYRMSVSYNEWVQRVTGTCIQVSYEDLYLNRSEETFEKIFNYLEIENPVVDIKSKRGNNEDTYKKLITNIDEIYKIYEV